MNKYYSLLISIFCFATGIYMVGYVESEAIELIGYIMFGLAGFNLRNFIKPKEDE